MFKFFKIKKLKIDYEEKIEEKSFRTRKKIKKSLEQEIKIHEITKKITFFFHFNHKWHCFYMWVLHVGIKFSIIISICHNRQYLYVTHTIGVSFGNSKPLQTWC